jgi:hypothetical protein
VVGTELEFSPSLEEIRDAVLATHDLMVERALAVRDVLDDDDDDIEDERRNEVLPTSFSL